MMCSSLRFADMVQSEIDVCLKQCNFDERQRSVFLMRTQNIPIEEIAEEINCSVSTVDRCVKTIKNKISKCIK